jgi:hypothetical protein
MYVCMLVGIFVLSSRYGYLVGVRALIEIYVKGL